MAEDTETGGEKTEAPSGRKLSRARQDGMVGKSVDLSQIMGMMAAFIALQHITPLLWNDMLQILKGGFTSHYFYEPLEIGSMRRDFFGLLYLVLPHILLLMVIAAFFGAMTTALQTNFNLSWKLLKPKFKNLRIIQGLKRIASKQNAVNLLKSLAKLAVVGPIAYYAFLDLFPQLIALMNVPINHVLPFGGAAASYVFWKIAWFFVLIGFLDLAWQKWTMHQQLKMTKVEAKDERKSVEGDESTRNKIRAKAFTRVRQRMFVDVRKADVIITNPTHIAVALSYKMVKGSAPKVVAKGRGYVAERIKQIARESGVPIVERKSLARALFKAVEIGQTIPYELYAAVAEILAYIYRLKGLNPFTRKESGADSANETGKRSKT